MFRRGQRHFRRYREIANILAKHGFGYVLDLTGLINYLPKKKQAQTRRDKWGAPERILHVLEELGPSFIKLGQIMSTRKDLFPEEYIEQLSKLQDEVPPFPFAWVEEIIKEELNKSIDDLFLTFEEQPLASASIGQVHKAVLKNGEEVVVKVQRPHIQETIETDLEILFNIARIAENRTNWGRLYQPVDIVEEFAQAIRNELDYLAEGRNAERFANNFADDATVVIPKVYWEYSSKKVLVLEYIEGIKISHHEALESAGVDRKRIAKIVVDAMLKQIFEDGFFHGDPHPGNLAVLSLGQVVFMDFGQVGRIDEWLRERFSDLIIALINQNVNAIVRSLLKIGIVSREIDLQALKKDVSRLKGKYYGVPMSQIQVGDALGDLLEISYTYKIRIPPEVILLIKSLITLEALVQELDPELSILDIAEPYGRKLLRQRFSPRKMGQSIGEYVVELGALVTELPYRLENVLNLLEEGRLKVNLEHENVRNLLSLLNLISNRLSLSIIIASLIVGSSLIAQKADSSILWRYPVAEVGFMIAVLMGLWLIWTIFRSGRF
ncbi:MAG: AarF/ABC1/UbiB kinase family protein [Thermoanaerobacteraceae bacterium]|nr:AarF/ABC1/UbiB kinase family protein [Thermoanaerobacteraceae bacterium]